MTVRILITLALLLSGGCAGYRYRHAVKEHRVRSIEMTDTVIVTPMKEESHVKPVLSRCSDNRTLHSNK
jgi:hypothetical protein